MVKFWAVSKDYFSFLLSGTFAITAIMTASTVLKYEGILYPSDTSHKRSLNSTDHSNNSTIHEFNPNFISNDVNQGRILISMALTFCTGIVQVCFSLILIISADYISLFCLSQVIFAIFHVGFVTKYLSDPIVAGFTTGAAIHIVVSQIGSLLGYSAKKPKIAFKLVGAFIEIFKKITETNLAAVIISIVAIVVLYLVKEQINYRFKDKMFMPVPIELLVVRAKNKEKIASSKKK